MKTFYTYAQSDMFKLTFNQGQTDQNPRGHETEDQLPPDSSQIVPIILRSLGIRKERCIFSQSLKNVTCLKCGYKPVKVLAVGILFAI